MTELKGRWLLRNGCLAEVTGFHVGLQCWTGFILEPRLIILGKESCSPLVWRENANEATGLTDFDLVERQPSLDDYIIGSSPKRSCSP